MKKLVLYFPILWNVHLKKDVGLFPIYLKRYFHEVEIIYFQEEGYDSLPTKYRDIKLIKLGSVKRYNKEKVSQIMRLKLNKIVYQYITDNKDITHFMSFHFSFLQMYLINKIKKELPNIKIYLKSDCSIIGANNLVRKYTGFWFRKYLKNIDLITVETEDTFNILNQNEKFKGKVHCAYNGYDDLLYVKPEIAKKEKTIITVGRLGTAPKNTELFLKIIKKLNLKDWKIKLIGPIEKCEKDFQKDIDKFYSERPDLKDKVIFTGTINDSDKLVEEYHKASAFVLTSRWESSALVLLEAAINGCYVLTTNVGIAKDLRYCYICPNSLQGQQSEEIIVNNFSTELQKLIDNQELCFENFNERNEFCESNFLMSKIIDSEYFKEWCE